MLKNKKRKNTKSQKIEFSDRSCFLCDKAYFNKTLNHIFCKKYVIPIEIDGSC